MNFDAIFEVFFESIIPPICMDSMIPAPASIDPQQTALFAEEPVSFEIGDVIDTGTLEV